MLGPFRNQEPVNFISLIIYLLALKLPFLFVTPEYNGHIHYYDLTPKISLFAATAVILIQAIWWNILFARLAFYRSRTLIPAAVFIACTSIFPEFNRLNEMHFILLALLFVLNQFLSIRTQEPGRVRAFYAGIALGTLGIFLHPAVTLVLFGYLCLFVKQPSSWREYAMYTLGVIAPFYLFGALELIFYNRPMSNLLPRDLHLIYFSMSNKDLVLLIFSGAFMLAGMAGFIQFIYSLHLLKQKLAFTLLAFSGGIASTILFSGDIGLGVFYIAILPMAIFLSLLKLRIPNPTVADVIHIIFVGTIISLQFIDF